MKITSSEPKDYLGISGKGLITSLGLKTNIRSKKNKKARYAITNASMKYLSNIIKEFEKLPYKGYVRKRPKQEPTDSYVYLERELPGILPKTLVAAPVPGRGVPGWGVKSDQPLDSLLTPPRVGYNCDSGGG